MYIGHSDIRTTYNRYGHLMPGGEREAAAKLDAFLEGAGPSHKPSRARSRKRKTRSQSGSEQYRHGDSNPGFRRERAAS